MKRYLVLCRMLVLLVICIVCSSVNLAAQPTLSAYNVSFGTASYKGQNYILLRSFRLNGIASYLAVDPQSLATRLIKSKDLASIVSTTFQQLCQTNINTPYIKALLRARVQSLPMQDAGITHALPVEKGITLTIDLCPSHKGLDRGIFTALTTAFRNIEVPVPVALSLTGKFLSTHQDDIAWLKQLVKTGQLNITWINHTYNHRYDPSLPLNKNFLLEPGTDINSEILSLEKAMIVQELLPSVFFRFPGLISNQSLVNKISSYGLITIGSDAWLAKDQQALPGSLVLIHGNGNEPLGVHDFIKLLDNEASATRKKQWLLYDLRTAASQQ